MSSARTPRISPNDLPPAPRAKIEPYTQTHHNEQIQDDYHWLRDPQYPHVNDPEILGYLNAENDYFNAAMQPLAPLVDELFEEMKARQPAQDSSVPWFHKGYWYQWRFQRDAQYRTWYRVAGQATTRPTQDDAWNTLLDETVLAAGQEYFRLGALSISPDGQKLAYGTDTDGSERFTLQVVDLSVWNAEQPSDQAQVTQSITDTLGSPAWSSDSNTLAYVKLSDQWRPYQVWLRDLTVTSAAAEDALIFEESDTGFFVGIDVSASEEYLFIATSDHTTSEVHLVPCADLTTRPQVISPRSPGHEYDVDHGAQGLVIRSNRRQPNFDLYTTTVAHPDTDNWRPFLNGGPDRYLTGFLLQRNQMIVTEKKEGLDQIYIHSDSSGEYIEFPEPAYEVSLGTNPEFDQNTLRLHYTSMVTPNTVLDFHYDNQHLETLKVQEVPSGYDQHQYVTHRLAAPARDGVSIPVSLVHRRDVTPNAGTPVYLYGYGAYGSSIPPSFSANRLSLLDRGFVFAIAHIRGGDDLGYEWYTQGKLNQRTNTFNDFVDVARYLIAQEMTGPGQIAIAGGSAGGELMGAAVNQAPELWGAVAAHVPFVDVLNTMLDESLPLTPMEWPEWGNPISDPEAFSYIQSYSPYDQLNAGAFPPILVTAGLNDPRVTYWEPAKYVAKLRTLKQDQTVLLLKTNMGAGHGGQSGRFDSLRELAEEYAFILSHLNATQDM